MAARSARASRLQNWPERLDRYLQTADATPFDWTHANCLLFCAGAVHAVTGHDPGAPACRADDEADAAARLHAAGGLLAVLTAALGRPVQNARTGRRGDIALADVIGPDGRVQPAPGVVLGDRVAFMAADGLGTLPLAACRLVWRVG